MKARYVYWQDGDHWLGHFEDYPDYLTQGQSLADLQTQLASLWIDLTSGEMPGIRRVGELAVS